jgi:hypothetical protein
LPDLLNSLQSRFGIYGILGNHDFWADAKAVVKATQEAGIELLHNGHRRLNIQELGPLLLLGCEDPWNHQKWRPPQVQAGELVLTLAHSADNIYRLNRAGASVVFTMVTLL